MERRLFSLVITTVLASLTSCHTAKQATTGSASLVGKSWKLVELNGRMVPPSEQSKKEPFLILNASEKRINGNGGCNSFFGSYELQGNNGITFSKIGSTKMACPNDVMEVELNLFKALESTNQFTLRNDTLILTQANMSLLAKFVVGDTK
jgi:heat shock protein HslJ